jgi:hypothetical protein
VLGAKQDEEVYMWEGKVSSWNKKVERSYSKHVISPKVDIHREEGVHSAAGRSVETANNNAVGAELG